MKRLINRGLLLLALIMGMAFSMEAQSTQVIVTLNDGSQQTYSMKETDRMYFENNEKLIIEQLDSKSITALALADVRKLTCHETEGTSDNASASLSLFPNPMHDVMQLRNLKGRQTVSIYALDGRLMRSFEAEANQVIDISDLAAGLYLVRTQSSTLKMIKL